MKDLQPDEDVQLVIDHELRLLQPEVRASAAELDRLLHPGFFEFGASGRKWDRPETITSLTGGQLQRRDTPATALEITGTRLAGDVVHVTYLSLRDRQCPPQLYLAPDKCGMAPFLPPGNADPNRPGTSLSPTRPAAMSRPFMPPGACFGSPPAVPVTAGFYRA